MGDLIDFERRRRRPRWPLTAEEKQFDAFVYAMRDMSLPALISALAAARDLHELSGIIDELAALVIYCTSGPDPAA